MRCHKDPTTIQVQKDTKLSLDGLGRKGDTYDEIIKRLIIFYERGKPQDSRPSAESFRADPVRTET